MNAAGINEEDSRNHINAGYDEHCSCLLGNLSLMIGGSLRTVWRNIEIY